MIRMVREFRLIPLVLIAITSLFILKVFGLALEGGYVTGPQAAGTQPQGDSWAQQMFNFPYQPPKPSPRTAAFSDVTGSVDKPPEAKGDKPPEAKADIKKPTEAKPTVSGVTIPNDGRPISPAERAILERLHERREQLETRARELEIRETLIQAAEKKLETRANELKDTENKILAVQQKKEESATARLKGVVTMYENMKAKEAAKIFDRLDIRILVDVATQINPRRMSDILAQMTPEAAERLTVELATRGTATNTQQNPSDLPKIEGRPGG